MNNPDFRDDVLPALAEDAGLVVVDSERELARQMLEERDEAESMSASAAGSGDRMITWPTTEYWYEIEKRASGDDDR